MDSSKFDEAIGEVPPSTVDVDAAISRGRRAAMIRRVANPVTGAAASVAAIAAAAIVFVPGGDRADVDQNARGGLVAGSSSSAPAEPDATNPDAPVVKRKKNGDVDASMPDSPRMCDDQSEHPDRPRQLSEALLTAVTEHIPESELSEVSADVGGDLAGEDAGPLEFHPTGASFDPERECHVPGEDNLIAKANVAQDGGTGNIMAMAIFDYEADGFGSCADARKSGAEHPQLEFGSCTETDGPNGERIKEVVMTIKGDITANSVSVLTADGTMVDVSAENAKDTAKINPAGAAEPPLNIEQLRQVALAMTD